MKGIVFEYKRMGVRVMDDSGCFRYVHGFLSMPVGAEIEFAPSTPLSWIRGINHTAILTPALSCAVAAIALFVAWSPVTYYVSVDSRPSVEVPINRFNRVAGAVSALNASGETLIEGRSFKGRRNDVIDSLLAASREDGHRIDDEGGKTCVMVMVSAKKIERACSVRDELNEYFQANGVTNVSVGACMLDYREKARSEGLSPGKFKLASQLRVAAAKENRSAPGNGKGALLDMADIAEMAVRDISGLIE